MDIQNIVSKCDHTLLKQTATFNDIKNLLDDGIKFGVASCCIPPCFVKDAKKYVENKLKICTVIGFPNGYNDIETKVFECQNAIKNGADEIDIVINIGKLKEKDYDYLLRELTALREATNGVILKVIIETCLLTEEEKIVMCNLVSKVKADYIKSSTGFSTGGATVEDVKLFKKHISADVKIKAAGGISSLEDAQNLIDAGALRLGTSKVVNILKGGKQNVNSNTTY